MGMFDYYRPKGDLRCPVCGRPLLRWQGKDGPNFLFVWVEGASAPVDQDVDDDWKLLPEERALLRLPPRFTIWCYDCPDHQPVEADGVAGSDGWSSTVMRPFKRR